jgi:hypothetical protein
MRFEQITYDQVIASAKMALNLENTTDYDAFFLLMADEAMRSIGDKSIYEFKTLDLPLDSGTAPLPCGFMEAMAVWFTNSDGTRCTAAPYVQRSIVNYCDCDVSACPTLGTSFQINGNHIVFHNPSAMSADEVSMAFLSVKFNSNNQPVMYERHERAVRAYLIWRYSDKLGRAQSNMGYRQAMMQDALRNQKEFVYQKKHIVGRAIVENFKDDKAGITNMFNAWMRPRPRNISLS